MLYLVGLGLYCDPTLRGIEIARRCHKVYLETYTSLVPSVEELKKVVGRDIIPLGRKQVEEENFFIEEAEKDNIAILVGGDPLVATTHIDILLRAKKRGIEYEIVHNASVYTAVAETGLQMYRFGKSASIVFPRPNFAPTSFFDSVKENLERSLHTLLFLDVIVEEGRFMNPREAMAILVSFGYSGMVAVCSRLGRSDSGILYGNIEEFEKLPEHFWGNPPHVLIIPANLHFMEEESLERFKKMI